MNPLLRPLLPSEALVAETDPGALSGGPLHPEEAARIAQAAPKRRAEFTAGRLLARKLLRRLGVGDDFALINDQDRAPIWPPGVVGTISHTRGRVAVAVARASELAALGCDLEQDEPLTPRLQARVCSATELNWLADRPEARRGHLAKLLFSAKEAVYKAQFPLTRTFLAFADVSIELGDQGEFEAILEQDRGPWQRGRRFPGRWSVAGGLVATAVAMRPSDLE